MLFIVGTFVSVLGIVFGLYWLFIEREDAQHQHDLKKRLKKSTTKGIITAALLKEKDRLSDVGIFNALLTSMGRFTDPMQRTISQSGVKMTVSTLLLASLCAASIGYLLAYRVLHMPLVHTARYEWPWSA